MTLTSSLVYEMQDYLILNYLKVNDLINAQIHLNKKLSLDKNRIMYKYNLYVLYKLQGNDKMASAQREIFEKAKLVNPQDYIDLSEIYFDLGKFEEAIKILNKGIKKSSEKSELYCQKAKILTLLNKTNEALEVYQDMKEKNN